MNLKVERALISVSDKAGIVNFAQALVSRGVEIISTGGTAKLLEQSGVPVIEISRYTGYPEMMDGRVKTLHPKVHGGLLAVRDNPAHVKAMTDNDIQRIDMVCVNLYPFEATVARPDCTLEEAIENIDIGGPSMLRSAAKNHKFVTVITDPGRYDDVIASMDAHDGATDEALRAELALEVFERTGAYDAAIARYLAANHPGVARESDYPDTLVIAAHKAQDLRYGENPHQSAAYFVEGGVKEPSVSTARQLSGKELSFNNIIDINGALEVVKEFKQPAVSVIKHTNPCGAAVGDSLADVFERAYSGDPISAFGCVIGSNRTIDRATAEKMAEGQKFVESIIAPDFEPEAIEVLTTKPKWGKNVRLLAVGDLSDYPVAEGQWDIKRVVGGILVQGRDLKLIGDEGLKVVTERAPTDKEMADLEFAWIICKHLKSNAVCLAANGTLVGAGAGQMKRVDSSRIAAMIAGDRAKGSVLASDAFFPFADGVEEAAAAGATAIIQPGGSRGDAEVIAAANKADIAMVFTGMRHFKH
jgi:phosphoribosylaminoimidazolecarboxamide formyltransferase / IMP cyclohydrolase